MTASAITTRVALVTYSALPDLSDDDRLLLPALERLGVGAELHVWNDPAVEWSDYAAVVHCARRGTTTITRAFLARAGYSEFQTIEPRELQNGH